MDYVDLYSEMDVERHLERLCAHIDKNGWVHLYNQIDYVKHLEDRIADLSEEKNRNDLLKKEIDKAIAEIDKITIKLNNFAEGKPTGRI